MQKITSKDNPNIKLYVKLAGGKKYRKENSLFTLEGVRLIEDAVKENAELHSVFVTESYVKKLAQQGEAVNFPNGVRLFEIPDEIGSKMSSTDSAQGIFAICKCLEKPSFSDTVRSGGRYLLLHSIQDPGNMGTIIRTADAVGIDAVFLADCCDLYNPKVVRSTMGSLFRLNISEIDFEMDFPMFEEKGVPSFAAVIDSDAVSLTECDFSKGGVILIGNEGNGLPREVSNMCTEKLTIKMQGNVNSLNAAMAAGIIMWELVK